MDEDNTPKEMGQEIESNEVFDETEEEACDKDDNCFSDYSSRFLNRVGRVFGRIRTTINIILYTLLGIIVTPLIDSLQNTALTGVANFDTFFGVTEVIAAPFLMMLAIKHIVDDLYDKGDKDRQELTKCRRELIDKEHEIANNKYLYSIQQERQKSKYELEIQQRDGIIQIKDYEINRLNDVIYNQTGVKADHNG